MKCIFEKYLPAFVSLFIQTKISNGKMSLIQSIFSSEQKKIYIKRKNNIKSMRLVNSVQGRPPGDSVRLAIRSRTAAYIVHSPGRGGFISANLFRMLLTIRGAATEEFC